MKAISMQRIGNNLSIWGRGMEVVLLIYVGQTGVQPERRLRTPGIITICKLF